MQVLSMFAGFGFDWPPAIRAIFNAFSLVNFNFELLAPECSVSIDFETKWCVRVVHRLQVWLCVCISIVCLLFLDNAPHPVRGVCVGG